MSLAFHDRERVLVTGAHGMVGRRFVEYLRRNSTAEIIPVGRAQCDLENADQVHSFFAAARPTLVYHLAARVGGIKANIDDPVGFMVQNVKMQTNVFEACLKQRPRKILFLGSSCIYPREAAQPMHESALMTGPLEPTNEGYAISKIYGLKLAEYMFRQYGLVSVCPMPCNIYGPGDTFDIDKSHVLSALVRRFTDAKDQAKADVTLWGTGIARREFIHVDDVCRGMAFLMEHGSTPDIVNLGTGVDISIRELAELISRQVGFEGEIRWDASKPNGMLRKCMDVSQLKKMGFEATVSFEQGVGDIIREYRLFKSRQ